MSDTPEKPRAVRRRFTQSTRDLVMRRADDRCEYCQTGEYNTGQPMHIEHITPVADGGSNNADNLCLACSSCNLSKGAATVGHDLVTDQMVPLFNPRQQSWSEHFQWSDGGLRIRGKTPIGRATIARLKMNQPRVIRARQNWIAAGNHPPKRRRR